MLSGENSDLLLAYCDRKLEPELAATLDRHVENCASCREALEGQRLLWRSLDAWEAAEITPDFNRRLYRRIEGGEPAWTRYFRPPAGAWRAAVAVASAAVVLLAAVLFRSNDPAPVSAADVEIEQVERTLEDIEMLRELTAQPPVDPSRTL